MERYINNTLYVLAQDLLKDASNNEFGVKDKDKLKKIHEYLESINARKVSFYWPNGKQYTMYPYSLVYDIKKDWEKIFPPKKDEEKKTFSEPYVRHSSTARKAITPFKKYDREDDMSDMVTAGMSNLSHDVYDYMYESIDRIIRESIRNIVKKKKLWV